MKHSHFNPGKLTWGCEACIARVKRDQVKAAAKEVVSLFAGYLSWPSVPCADRLAKIEQSDDLDSYIWEFWEDEGYDRYDLHDMFWYWDRCLADRRATA